MRLFTALFGVLLLSVSPAYGQQNLTWDPNGAVAGTGGNGTWNTSGAIWFTGAAHQAWVNATQDNAIFTGTAGTVALGAAITAHNLTFNTTGYTITSNTLTLAGTTPTINLGVGSATIASVIAGTAGLSTAGTGTLILTGANTYSGGTTISGGTLQVGAGGTTGTLGTGAVTNNSALVFNRSNALTVTAAIGGTGTLTQAGTNVLSLSGTNSYSGVTTINSGTLSVGAGGATGDLGASSQVINSGTLQLNRTGTLTLGQAISGTGNLTKLATGVVTLTGSNTYSGTTTISGGTLQIGDGGTSGTLGAGNVTVTGGTSLLRINRSDTVTLGQVISGSGDLAQAGSGTLILTGTNTFTGGTTVSGGTLQIGAGGTTGTAGTGAVVNNAAVVFNRSDTLTAGAVISGTGTVTQAGSGTLILTGTNTYSGGTTISGGTLQVGAGGTTGTLGTGAVTNNSALVFNRNNALTVAAAIGGTGTLTQAGTNVLSLSGTNSYSGVTTINSGTLSVGAGGATGDLGASSQVINSGTLQLNRTGTLTLGQAISGTGNLTKLATGVVTLTGSNTYSGTTTISGGTLQIGNGGTSGTLGTGNITVTGGTSLLRINRSDTVTLGQVISGSGDLAQAGSGTLILTGTNTFTGGTTVSGGTLQIGAGGTTGTAGTGAVVNNAAVVFNRSDTLTAGAVISGTGTVTQAGSGTLILTGANTYSGGTTISGGTLQVGAGGTTGTLGTGAVTNNSALVFNRSNALTVTAAIGGTGTLTQAGTNVLSLSGTNSYSGVTTINSGTLSVGAGGATGDLGASSQVINSGTLQLNRTGTLTLGQAISGTGNLTKLATGVVTLTGSNTYSGTTTISGGTLQIGNGGTSGTLGTGNITVTGGTSLLRINRSDTVTLGQAVSGTGGLAQAGTGTTILTGTNSYSGVTTVSVGTLQIGTGGTTGTVGTGGVTNNGAVVFNRSDVVTAANVISGTGTLTQAGSGTLILTGTNTYSGGTTIGSGTLQVGAGGTTGTLGPGAVTNNSALVFNRNNALTVTAAIGGTGTLTQAGTSVLSLTGTNSYSGVTTIASGTLQVGNGGTTGSLGAGNVIVNAGATLGFNRSDAMVVGNAISGAGSISQVGSGMTTLTAAGITVGGTNITVGTLDIDGTLNTATVNMGGGVLNVDGTVQASGGTQTVISNIAGSATSIIVNSGATLRATGDLGDGDDAFDIGGTLDAGGGTMAFGDGSDLFTLRDTATLLGSADGGAGADRLTLAGTGIGTLDVGVIGPSGTLRNFETFFKDGSGSWTLTGLDSNTTPIDWTISAGTLIVNADSLRGNVTNNGALHFDQAAMGTYAGAISGTGALTKRGAGTLALSGTSSYSGATAVSAGTLLVNGSLGNTAVSVAAGARLGGIGSIGGPVTIDSGATLAPGLSPGTLTVGSLNLLEGSILDYELATPGVIGGGVNDLVEITSDLTLDGMLNVTGLAGFGVGTYRLMNYGGSLVDNQLRFGFMPVGYAYGIQATVPGQVNLNVAPAPSDPIQYWDGGGPSANGVVNGGSGIWAAGLANWTDSTATFNQAWGGQAAVFAGTSGTVAVVGQISFTSLDFRTGGYVLGAGPGGTLRTTAAAARIRADSGITTIAVPVTGTGGLDVRGRGTIALTAANTYTGGTEINGGTLSVSSDGNLGAASGSLYMSDGALRITRDFVTGRTITLGAGGGALDIAAGTTSVFASDFAGTGDLRAVGAGSLLLTGAAAHTGGTVVESGTLHIGNCGTSGSLTGDVRNESLLVFSRSDATAFGGSISGTGSLVKSCAGTLTLTGDNTYAGGTLVAAGILRGDTRSLQGEVVNNGSVIFDQALDGRFAGTLFGTGTTTKTGVGTLLLTGAHQAVGLTTIEQGTLALGGTLAGAVTVKSGATFDAVGMVGVGGDVLMSAGSQFGVAIDALGGSSTLVTPGRAVIEGANVLVRPQAQGYGRVTQYGVLRADAGISGSATASSSLLTLEPYLTKSDTTLFVTLLRMDLPLQPYATSVNGSSLGSALDRVKRTASGDLARVIREMTALDDAGLAVGLDSVAGEIHASAVQLAVMDADGMMSVVRAEIGNRTASRAEGATDSSMWRTGRRRAWFRARTERASFATETAGGGRARLQGYALGADWVVNGRWLVGVGGSYADGRLTLDSLEEAADVAVPRAVGYVGYARTRWALDGGVSAARTIYDVRRQVRFTAIAPTGQPLFGGVDREAVSSPSGPAMDMWGEARVNSNLGSWSVQPTLGIRHSRYALGAWSESGADALSLRAESQAVGSTQADAGVLLAQSSGGFRPFVSARYRRELTDGRTSAILQVGESRDGAFEVQGLRIDDDAVSGEAGFRMNRRNVSMSLSYEAQRMRQHTRHLVQFAIGFE